MRQWQILDTTWEIALIGVSPLLLALALPLGVVAASLRRWVLTLACALLLACWGLWAGPDFWPIAHAAPAHGPTLHLFDANVSQANHNLTELGHEIENDHPQVIILEEVTRIGMASLRRTGALAPYRWHLIRPERAAGGIGFWSRLPTSGLRAWTVGDGQMEVEARVRMGPSDIVAVDGVHVYAPAFGLDQPEQWKRQLASVRAHLATQPRPLLVAGDFNSTWDMRPFQRIMHLGLSDAAVEEGRGWQMTWPRDQARVAPYLRLDHVLYSQQLTVASYHLGTGTGSDHRPLLVSVAPA